MLWARRRRKERGVVLRHVILPKKAFFVGERGLYPSTQALGPFSALEYTLGAYAWYLRAYIAVSA